MTIAITETTEPIVSCEYKGQVIDLVRLPTGRDAKIALLQQERKKCGFSEALLARCVRIDNDKLSFEQIGEWEVDFVKELGDEIFQVLVQFDDPRNTESFPKSFKFATLEQVEGMSDRIFDRYPDRNLNALKSFFQSGGTESDREFAIQLFDEIESPIVTQIESQKLKHGSKAQSLATGKVGSNSWGFEYSLRLACQLLMINGKNLNFDEFLDLEASLCQAIAQYFTPKENSKKKKKFTRLKR
ncbi:MAG: hypothetical protein J7647_26185 [Cyanobacteria bacterium SBLK]|nr:hypothetical protein [Cyanobacteria bacterium SBLK]